MRCCFALVTVVSFEYGMKTVLHLMVLISSITSLSLSLHLELEDLVVAIPTSAHRLDLVWESRSWRSSLRAVIVTNATQNIQPQESHADTSNQESMYVYPDEVHSQQSLPHSKQLHAKRPGDLRAALTPFIAHEHFMTISPQYKWMLYGENGHSCRQPSVKFARILHDYLWQRNSYHKIMTHLSCSNLS
jgi:hypothetical protein